MGLFDGILDNPQAMGLLAAGANMLANNGTRPYGTVWQSLGDGLLGGMQTAQAMKQQQQEQAWKQKQQAMQEQEYALKNQEMQAKLAERANEAKRMEMFKSSPGALGFGVPFNAPQARQLIEQDEDLGAINEGLNSVDPNGGVPIQAPRLGVFGQAATMQGLPAASVAQLQARQAALDSGGYANPKDVSDSFDQALRVAPQTEAPSNIREWQAFQTMTPEQQKQYLEMKRAVPIMNLGGSMAVRAPGGGISEQYQVTPKPEEMPEFQGKQARAKETAKAEVERAADAGKKDRQADNLLSNIAAAETILKKGNAPGSIGGAAVTAVKRGVGYSDDATQDDKQLKLISGWMVANVPRMEGPQSNYDVDNYKQMAAAVGDSTIPRKDRLAALAQLKALQAKYKAINQGGEQKSVARTAPPAAIEMLRKNPGLAPQFKQKYGYLP